jgi:hypothetical protein
MCSDIKEKKMAAGLPTKANFTTGAVLLASEMNDLAGTVNMLGDLTLRAVTTTSDTILITDINNYLITYSSTSAVAITIPTNATAAIPVGSVINLIKIGATGTITISGAVGVTVASAAVVSTAPTITTAFSAASLIKVDTNSWYCVGKIV